MATNTAPGTAAWASFSPMNPTTTQHDFRFPRRPDHLAADRYGSDLNNAASPAHSKASSDLRSSLQELRLDISSTYDSVQDRLNQFEAFPSGKHGRGSHFNDIQEMQREDPLAIQVWKFYARTKLLLPDQQRMENLSWRMMHGTLIRRRHEQLSKYVLLNFLLGNVPRRALTACSFFHRRERPGLTRNISNNAPSGIAQQLRKSSEQDYASQAELMNIDDFIFPDSAATPLASHAEIPVAPHHDGEDMQGVTTSHSHSSAIPIKSRKDPQQRFTPQSVPFPPRHQGEFNYVTRHHRKTSIDDRRVSSISYALTLNGFDALAFPSHIQ